MHLLFKQPGEWIVEYIVQYFVGRLVEQTGDVGTYTLFLAFGLGLLVIGPWAMNRANRQRLAVGRKPKYGWLEKGIVITGGLVFTAVGTFALLGLSL